MFNKKITTNFYPINLEFEYYTILQIPYEEGLLEKLRCQHNPTHSFFKNDNFIYSSNKKGGDMLFGGKLETLSVIGDERVTSSLIKHLFFRTFKDTFQGIIPIQFYPFRIISRNKSDDLVYDVLPTELKDKISYKKQIELQLRVVDIDDKPTFGFVINVERRWIFNP